MPEVHEYELPHELKNQPQILLDSLKQDSVGNIRTIADALTRDPIDDICCVGAGDSHFASMAAENYFARWGGRLIHAYDALEFSRHMYKALTERSITFALSYGGETIRTLEACYAARSQGSRLVVLTRDPQSSMARAADHVVMNVAGVERSNCRTGSFQSMHLSLLYFSLAMGSLGKQWKEAEKLLSRIEHLVSPMEEYILSMEKPVQDISEALGKTRRFYFLGAGIGRPIAHYGASKLYETASTASIISGLEQFSHCEIFSIDPGDCVVVIAQDGPSYVRAVEVAGAIRKIGCTVWGLSDNPEFEKHSDVFTVWPSTSVEELSLIMAVVPLQWFAYYRGIAVGDNPDRVRHKDVNSPLIRNCSYWTEKDYAEYKRERGM